MLRNILLVSVYSVLKKKTLNTREKKKINFSISLFYYVSVFVMLHIQNILGVHERHVNLGKELVKWLSIIPPHSSPQKQLSSSPKYNSFNHIHHYSQQFLSSSHKHLPLKSMTSPILNNHWHNSNLPVYPSLKKNNSPFPRSCGLPVSP